MFDWFWNFLYSISKNIYRIIDGLMNVANMMCGIDPITINQEETDLISYLFNSNNVQFAFKATAIIGFILVILLSVIAIIRTAVKEKVEDTPGQICIKAFKAIITFMFVPFLMIVIVNLCNVFMIALYKATLAGNTTLGDFMFVSFAQDSDYEAANNLVKAFPNTQVWLNTDTVRSYIDITEYNYFFSWLAGVAILVNIAWSLLLFVDRAISLVILYILSPLSIASTVVDGGARFKMWRDQTLTKFAVGYGTIIGLNVYLLVINAIIGVTFFENQWLNMLVKILFIVGGALSMKKAMALVGNLVTQGGGSQELREQAMGRGALMKSLGGFGSGVLSAGFGGLKAAMHPAATARNVGSAIANKFGFGGSGGQSEGSKQLEAQNKTNELLSSLLNGNHNNASGIGGGSNAVKNAIQNSSSNSGGSANNNIVNSNNDLNEKTSQAITNSKLESDDKANQSNQNKK